MKHYYTNERNAQIVIELLKAHGIRKVIASPGTTNICFVASIQQDPFFEIYSAPEERSAGYMACGLAAESGEPVVISCTGATASRNYMPALTEAFYRKLPVLAVTSSRRSDRIGHNMDQVTDRSQLPKDVAKLSVQVPLVYDQESEWADVIAVNKAILELSRHGNGPVHINLETNYSIDYSVKEIPHVRAIFRIYHNSEFPKIESKRVAIMVGAHLKWNDELTMAVDSFCERHNGVVLCDHLSNYKGKYRILANLNAMQINYRPIFRDVDLLIHIGDITASNYAISAKEVWRVNPDGELRDTYGKLKYVFEMEEIEFFNRYAFGKDINIEFFEKCKQEENTVQKALSNQIDEFPFSNAWAASKMAKCLPENAVMHFGIQNSVRFWSFFDIPKSVLGYCNTGGFGIDGTMSSVIGAALSNPEKIYFCVLGDLAFFYDMNSLGNRHVGKNLRILLVNNGKGTEFKLKGNPGYLFGEETDRFIAAAGHYGKQSRRLVKDFVENLGFEYLTASNKEEFMQQVDEFVSPKHKNQPILMEIFTNSNDENEALMRIKNCFVDEDYVKKHKPNLAKETLKGLLGEQGTNRIKALLGKDKE